MKKVLVAALIASTLLMAPSARAEQKLLSTAILDAGQVEVLGAFEIYNAKLDVNLGIGSSEIKDHAQGLYLEVGAGLGAGIEVSASLPYLISEKVSFAGVEDESDGLGDLTIGAKYSLMHGEEAPVALAIGLDYKFDSASDAAENAGTGTTEISPYLTLSREIAEQTALYATYRATFVDKGEGDEHSLTIGLEKKLSETLTLDLAVNAALFTSGDEISSYHSYGAEVACYIETLPNLYLLPTLAIDQSSSFDLDAGGTIVAIDPKPEYFAGIALYYLY